MTSSTRFTASRGDRGGDRDRRGARLYPGNDVHEQGRRRTRGTRPVEAVLSEGQRVHRAEAVDLHDRRVLPVIPGMESERQAALLERPIDLHVAVVVDRLVAHRGDVVVITVRRSQHGIVRVVRRRRRRWRRRHDPVAQAGVGADGDSQHAASARADGADRAGADDSDDHRADVVRDQ